MDKIKKSLLDDCREHLILAVGSAAGAGEHETAVRINQILIDIDIAQEMCYTGKNARNARKNEEEKTMKKYAVYTHYDSSKTVIGYIIPLIDNGTAFITQRTYNALLKKRTIGGNAGIYSDYPGEIRISNDDKTEFIGWMQ